MSTFVSLRGFASSASRLVRCVSTDGLRIPTCGTNSLVGKSPPRPPGRLGALVGVSPGKPAAALRWLLCMGPLEPDILVTRPMDRIGSMLGVDLKAVLVASSLRPLLGVPDPVACLRVEEPERGAITLKDGSKRCGGHDPILGLDLSGDCPREPFSSIL